MSPHRTSTLPAPATDSNRSEWYRRPAGALERHVLRVVSDCVSRFDKAPLLRTELAPAIARMAGVDEATAWQAVARCLNAGWLAGVRNSSRSTRVHPSAARALDKGYDLHPVSKRNRARVIDGCLRWAPKGGWS